MDLHQANVPLSSIIRKNVDRYGWLTVLNSNPIRKAWKRRYCVLRGSRLFIFKSDKADEPVAAMLNLDAYASINVDMSFRKVNVFRLEPQPMDAASSSSQRTNSFFKLSASYPAHTSSSALKPFVALCDDENELYFWMEAIRNNLIRVSSASVLDSALAKLDYDKYRKIPKPRSTMSIKVRNSEESLDSITYATSIASSGKGVESAASSVRSKSPDHEDRDLLYPMAKGHRLGYRGARKPVSGWAQELSRRRSSPYLSSNTTSPLAQASHLMASDLFDEERPRALTLQSAFTEIKSTNLFPELHDFRVICSDDVNH